MGDAGIASPLRLPYAVRTRDARRLGHGWFPSKPIGEVLIMARRPERGPGAGCTDQDATGDPRGGAADGPTGESATTGLCFRRLHELAWRVRHC